MPHSRRLLLTLTLALAACHSQAVREESATLTAPVRPLAALAAQQVIVTPLNGLREVDALGWTQRIPRSRDFMRAFDDSLQAELGARGLATQWVYPAALVRAGRINPSYSVDPYTIAAAPLRSPTAIVGAPIGNPLASQLRTMVALEERARAVLIPVELRFDRLPDGQGVAVLRLALVDGRIGEVRWIGEIHGTPAATFSHGLLSSLVAHTADLITAR